MRNILLLFALIALTTANSQVVISSNPLAVPDPSAMLTVDAGGKGLLIPRMTEADRLSIAAPAQGLWVYQTDLFPGYYIYSGAEWIRVAYNNTLKGKVVYNESTTAVTAGSGYGGYTIGNPSAGEFNISFTTPFSDIPTVMVTGKSVPGLSNIDPSVYCYPAYSQNCTTFINADYIDDVILTSRPGGVPTAPTPTGPISFSNTNTGCNNTPDNYVNYFPTITGTVYGTNVGTGGFPGSDFNLQMSSGPEWLDNLFAWIDWNQDGDFADANETIFEHYFTSAPYNTLITEPGILVPAAANNGTTVLRTMTRYITTVPDACGTGLWGESQDYRIEVLGANVPSANAPRACDCIPSDITTSGFKVFCSVVTSNALRNTSFDFYATEN